MAKTYKVIVNTGKQQAGQTFDVVQGAGDRGQPVRIKAQAGAKYQLQEMERQKQVAPDGVKVKRVGKDLWLMFEDERQPSVILEDYYQVMPEGYNGVMGQAENGLFYEYIPEDPNIQGLVSELAEGGQAVNVALGGVEVSGSGAAVGVVAFPWLGALGVIGGVGAAGVVVSQALKKDEADFQGGDLASASDSGPSSTDNVTQTKTNLLVQGKGTPGSTMDVLVKNSAGVVVYQGQVTVDAEGHFSYTVPGPLADGVYTPYTGGTQGSSFTVDTVTRVDITEPGQVGSVLPIGGTAEPGGTVVVKGANGQVLGTATANAQGTWQITPSSAVPAGAITAEVTDAAGNQASDRGEPVSPSVKTALSIDPISGDNVLLASESGASSLPVTGQVTGTFTAGDVVNLSLNGKTYAAVVSENGRFSVPVPMADFKADPDTKIEGRITGTGGDTATAAQDYSVEPGNTPTQTALRLDPVTADNVLSAAENTGNVAITGQATGKFAAGDAVTVSVNGKTFTGTVAANGQFSINVPAADLAADPDTQLQARLSGSGGSTAQAVQDYALDLIPGSSGRNATIPPSGELAPASDSGVPGDATTHDSTPTLIGQVPAGSTATITLNGKTYPVTVASDGSYSFTQPDGLPDGTYTPVLNVTQNGQTTATPIEPFTIDTVTRVDITEPGRVGSLSPISGTAEPGGTVVVKGANGQVLGTATANAQGAWQITPSSAVPTGAITAEVTDPAGNKANDSDMPVSPSVKTALSIDPISGDNILLANESGAANLNVTGTVTGTFSAGDVVNLSLNGKTYAASVGADGRFSVPVSMADLQADPDTQIEGRITGTGGDTATAVQDYSVEAGNISIQTALSLDPVTADNVLSAAENTGNVAITGQATGKFAAGDAVTVSVNGKTFTGTVAANGEFSINVPAADLAADPDTQLQARLSGSGGSTAQAMQDYALDTVVPDGVKTALSIDPISGDNVLLASESGASSLPVTGQVTGTFTAGDVVNLSLNGKTYAAVVSENGRFSVPVPMADFKADPDTKIEGRITGTGGDTATAAQDYSVEPGNTPTQTALRLDPVTADNVLSAAENTGNVAITGQATGKFAAGDAVTVSVNGKTFTGTVAANGQFSINVPAADLAADPDTQLQARLSGSGGSTAQAVQDYALDLIPGSSGRNATIPPSGELAPASDSGVPGDYTTQDNTPEFTGKVPAGATATVTLNGKTYPVTVAPDGSWRFTQPDGLPDGTYTPVLNVTQNGQTTATPIEPFTIDTVPPSVVITGDKTQLLAGQSSTITFTLSEAVSDFSAADVTVSGGALSGFTRVGVNAQGQDIYTATFTPTAQSTTPSVISVASGRFSDAANNFNTDGAEANNTLTLPTNTQTPGGTAFLAPSSDSGTPGDHRTNDNTPAIAGQVTPGSTAVVNINGIDYPVNVQPDGSYTFTVPAGLPDGTYLPKIIITPAGSSTPNPAQDGTPFTIDTVAPTMLVSTDKATLATGQTATITFTLSEDSTDFTLADVAVTGGTLSNLKGSGKVYTATFTPTANSTTPSTVKVDSLKFSDAAGNYNIDGADTAAANTNIVSMPTNTVQADTTAPTIALSADRTSLATGQTTVVTFALSEASSDFTLADITATGGTLGNLVQSQTDPKTYTAVFTPNTSSTTPSVISVASNKFSDAAGNMNADGADANNTLSLPTNTTPDQTSGQLQPQSDSGTKGDNKTLDNTPAYGGTAPAGSQVDVVINGKTYTTVADSQGQYTVVVPDALPDGTYVPKIIVTPAGSSTPNPAQEGTPFTIDTTPPTVVVSSDKSTLSEGQTATLRFELNEASVDFSLSDVDVSGGTLSNFQGSGTVYTATFTPDATTTSTSVVHVASNKFADAAGNFNTDGAQSNNTVSMVTETGPFQGPTIDITPPSVIVSRAKPGTVLAANAIETINFTLSEPSLTFGLSDVNVTGGTLSNFTAVPSSGTAGTGYTQYTATFTPTSGSAGTAAVGVASGKFSDNAGNLNTDTYVPGDTYESDNLVSLAYNTVPVDATSPTVALSRTGTGSLTQGGTETITFVLSEASTNFSLADVDVSGGTLANFAPLSTSGNATSGYTQYTATFTPNANALGTASIGVASGRFTDAGNNANLDTYLGGVTGTSQEANNLINIDFNTQLADSTAPTVAVARASAGTVSSTETVYFTLSEASTSFTLADVDISGGTLTNFTPVLASGNSTTGYTEYTATFTPTANATGTAVIGVASSKFSDAAGNLNKDTFLSGVAGTTQEANNSVAIAFNTVPASAPTATADTLSAVEAGGTLNGTTFVDPTGNVLTNDSGVTNVLLVQDIKAGSGASTAVGANSTSTSNGTTVNGTYGTLVIGADGSYKYTPNNANATVQALRTSSDTLSDVFTYTVKDGNGATSTTTLTATLSGSNDAPVVSVQEADQTATIGTAFSYTVPTTGTGATFTDVDSGDSLTYTASLAGGGALPSWLSFNASTKTFSGTAPAGTTASTLNLAVTATDKGGLTATDTFSINVGNNHAPTLSPITAPSAVAEAANASSQTMGSLTGTLSANDVDSGNTVTASAATATATYSGGTTLPTGVDVSTLIASSALTFGTGITPNGTAGNITLTYNPSAANLDWLPKGKTLTLTYPVTVSDGQGGTASQNLVITVTGTNDAPVVTASSQSFNKGAASSTINLLANATDPDLGETATLRVDTAVTPTYVVTTNSSNGTAQSSSTTVPAGVTFNVSTGQLTIDPSNSTITTGLAANQNETIVVTYNVVDAQGTSVQTTSTIVINGSGSNAPVASNDTATAVEAGVVTGTNPTGNVLTNDSIVVGSKMLQDIKLSSASTATAVTSGSTSTSNATSITGSFGTLLMGADGSYTYNVDNTNSTVQALRTSSNTLTENFTYTLKDGQGGTSTATLVVTVQGANDAPVAVADTATATEAGGTANGTAGTDPTGNVLTNDTDVDSGDTKVVQDAKAGTTGSVVTVASGSTSTSSAATITGSFGALKLGADGSYTYVVDNANTTVQALKSSADTVTDTFTYTVKDTAGATSTNTVTVTVQGANDAPLVSTATTPSSTQTNLQAFNFGTAFSLADVDVGSGTMTLTLSSNVTDGIINVNTGTSGATITSGNGTNSVVIRGTLAQLQALTATAANFSFVDSASQSASRNVTISAVLNDNGNQGGSNTNALSGSNSFTVSMGPDANASAKIDITAISADSGVSTSDYITNDNTLVYSGTVSSFTNNGDKVKLELIDSTGAIVATTSVTPTLNGSNGTWTWNDPVIAASTTRADGNYTLRATIVDSQGNRVAPTTTVGSNTGTQDVQALVIDTNTPNVDPNKTATIDIVRIDDALSTTTAATGSKDTGTSSTDFVTSDGTLKYFGTLTGFDGSKGDLVKLDFKDSTGAVLRSAYVTPTLDSSTNSYVWTWDDTSNTRAAGNYTLVATIIDQAGNVVNTTAPVNGTNGGDDSQWVVIDSNPPVQTVSFGSMTKDTGLDTVTGTNTSATANWTTADASAGRLVTGALSGALSAGDVVEVYANGVKLGNATVNGTNWIFTDTTFHGNDLQSSTGNAGWTYSAKVVDAAGNGGISSSQNVNGDYTEAAPVITAVLDTSTTSIANNGTTVKALSSVSGTGQAGDVIYLYDNTSANLVGSAVVNSSGTWTVTNVKATQGSNTFAAKQLDTNGNESVLSNLWTVTSDGTNMIANGDFEAGVTGFTPFGTAFNPASASFYDAGDDYAVVNIKGSTNNYINADDNLGTTYTAAPGTLSRTASQTNGNLTWFVDQLSQADQWPTNKSVRANQARTFESLSGTVGESNSVLTGTVFTAGSQTIYSTTVQVEAGKTYNFSFDYMTSYWAGNATGGRLAAVFDGVRMEIPDTDPFITDQEATVGTMTATYTATTSKTVTIKFTGTGSGSYAYGDYALDNITLSEILPSANNSLVSGQPVTATPNPDQLTYAGGALSSLASADVITVTGTDLQAKLATGGYINGGAGADTLKLAGGTTLNLETLTGNQTVRPLQEIEVITMQGGSSTLTVSANDVLSLGSSDATAMAKFAFAPTASNFTAQNGATSVGSIGKVQFVVNGQTGDKLNLDALSNDGVTGSNGLLGNTGLNGSWAFTGTLGISAANSLDGVAHTYKVFDHSTTSAQVLVDSNVNVSLISPITVAAISTDSGNSTTDFLTNDTTLIYSGIVPAVFDSATQRVRVQLFDSTGTEVTGGSGSQYAIVNGTTWTWDNQATSRAAGDYVIKATIVALTNDTPVGSYGTSGTAQHALTIDSTANSVIVSRSTGAGIIGGTATETITFTLSEASNDFTLSDIDVTGGALSNFAQSTINPLVYTATFTPSANSTGTAKVGIIHGKFTDAAGNVNVDTHVSPAPTGATFESNNQVSIPVDTAAPTQTVSFSSMTKDSGVTVVTTNNTSTTANWTTADASAGRLVSGAISNALATGEVVEVYANGVKLGTATVNGNFWEFTDTTDHVGDSQTGTGAAGWTYSAKVVDAAGNAGTATVQNINGDYVEAAPVITAVVDSADVTIADGNTTSVSGLKSVSGTGIAGDVVYVLDNTYNTMVGSTTVAADGTWTLTTLNNVATGGNTFAAYHMDPHGNQSVLSNLYTVNNMVYTGFDAHFGTVQKINYVEPGMTLVETSPDILISSYDPTLVGRIASPDGGAYYSAVWQPGVWNERTSFTLNNLVPGQTYNISFYQSVSGQSDIGVAAGHWEFVSGGAVIASSTPMARYSVSTGQIWDQESLPFVATASSMTIIMQVRTEDLTQATRLALDGLTIAADNSSLPNTDGSLAAGGTGGSTLNNDNLTYAGTAIDALAGNDVITVSNAALQAKLVSGSYIDGGAGVDTLKLAASTMLDLRNLTDNQTVAPIKEVEIFQLQGTSTLNLSANDVLSLGGSNATTMSAFTFSATSTGSGTGFSSAGKVQFVVKGTSTDVVNLSVLDLDGVIDSVTNSEGNTGLAGTWSSAGTVTIGGTNYQVFNHSTTEAQVLVSNATVNQPAATQSLTVLTAEANNVTSTETFDIAAINGVTASNGGLNGLTTGDGVWKINVTTGDGVTPVNKSGSSVAIYNAWTTLGPDSHLFLGEQSTQTIAGGRRQTYFESLKGDTFDSIKFDYSDCNFTGDLWINFYDASGALIERTPFNATTGRVAGTQFSYTLTSGLQAKSFMIDMNTDDSWGIDNLVTGLGNSTQVLTTGANTMDSTPMLRGAFASNLAPEEVIAVYDGTTKLGNATVDLTSKTWSFQLTSAASAATHTYSAKVLTAAGTTTATSNNFTLSVLASPLVLDLNGDGVQTLDIDQGVQFDLTNAGAKQSVGWVDKHDGLLVMDLNHDGVVNNGAELLGSSTPLTDGSLAQDGWQALAQYDTNTDGLIDIKDALFLDLRVWVDANSNGQTDAGELRSLADHHIVRLDLNYAAGEAAQNGNILQGLSSFTTADGQSHQMVDAWLKVEQVLSSPQTVVAPADAAPMGELLQLNQLLSPAPQGGVFTEVLPVLDSGSSSAMLQSMLDLHTQNALHA